METKTVIDPSMSHSRPRVTIIRENKCKFRGDEALAINGDWIYSMYKHPRQKIYRVVHKFFLKGSGVKLSGYTK